jgi:hypothetical protein
LGRRGTKKSQIASDLRGGARGALAALTGLLAIQVNNKLQEVLTTRRIKRRLARQTVNKWKMGKAILLW